MICKNCGSDNARGAKNCINCNFPLGSERISLKPAPLMKPEREEPVIPAPTAPPKPVIKPHPVKKVCPQCKYELIFDADICPMCSFNFLEQETRRSMSELRAVPILPPKKDLPPAEAPAIQPPQPTPQAVRPTPGDTPPGPTPVQPSEASPQSAHTTLVAHQPELYTADTVPTSTPDAPENYIVDQDPAHTADIPPALNKSIRPPSKPTTSPFVNKKEKKAAVEGTIDPFRNDQASVGIAFLKPVSREGEKDMDTISLAGSEQPLPVNRSVLDAENNTITSKVQAVFEFRDGGWYISDKSDQQTTFVRATGEVKLEKGDIILMGNRKFIFDY